jgi:hypothetical protein
MKLADLVKTYLENYNFLIDQLAYLFTDDDYKTYLSELNNESKDKKWDRCIQFNKLLTDEYFDLFIESKLKLFSHKDEDSKVLSESLFGEKLALKKIFNNRDDSIKNVIWYYLHIMVLMIELAQKNKNNTRIEKLRKIIDNNITIYEKSKNDAEKLNKTGMSDPKNIIKDMLGVDVNVQTNDMIGDIVKSFESTMANMKKGEAPDMAALFPSILEISKNISDKYSQKISSGEIELEKIMGGITKNIPGMDGNLDNINKMMGGNIGEMMGGMFKKEEKKELVIIDEDFSTSQVDLGKIKESSNINIGKMLNVADSFGVIPGLDNGSDNNKMPKLNDLLGMMGGGGMMGAGGGGKNMPNLNELFSMVSSMDKANTKEGAEEMQNKLSGMLSSMGLDMNKINKDLESFKDKNNEMD